MNALVIGRGAAGRRHATILSTLGYNTFTVSNHTPASHENFHSMFDAFDVQEYEYVVISNETSKHEATHENVRSMGYLGKILIEKPLNFSKNPLQMEEQPLTFVGFNLRYLPVIDHLRAYLAEMNEQIIQVNLNYGNSTDNWRTGENRESSYSRSALTGGGVLRDFCHEIDLACWIFGVEELLYSYGDRLGDFMLDGEDFVKLILTNQRKYLVTITLDSLQIIPKRTIQVVTLNKNIEINLLNGVVRINNEILRFDYSIDQTYVDMHTDILTPSSVSAAKIQDGFKVDNIICQAEGFMQQNRGTL